MGSTFQVYGMLASTTEPSGIAVFKSTGTVGKMSFETVLVGLNIFYSWQNMTKDFALPNPLSCSVMNKICLNQLERFQSTSSQGIDTSLAPENR